MESISSVLQRQPVLCGAALEPGPILSANRWRHGAPLLSLLAAEAPGGKELAILSFMSRMRLSFSRRAGVCFTRNIYDLYGAYISSLLAYFYLLFDFIASLGCSIVIFDLSCDTSCDFIAILWKSDLLAPLVLIRRG